MKIEIVDVTPQMAKEWLDRNTRNRPLNAARVTRLANQMRDGEWRLTHQGISFATDGSLTDGQHRLAAIVESGETVRIPVAQGVDDFDVLDAGRSRSAGDALAIEGVVDPLTAAAAIRLIMRYYDGSPRPWAKRGVEISNQSVHLWALGNLDALRDSVAMGRRVGARIGGSRSAYAAAHFVAMKWATRARRGAEAAEWWESLATGADIGRGDPRLALASWVSNTGRTGTVAHMAGELTMMLTLRAFVAALTGEKLARLMMRDTTSGMVRLPGDEKIVKATLAYQAMEQSAKAGDGHITPADVARLAAAKAGTPGRARRS